MTIIDDEVIDCAFWIDIHPGGKSAIENIIGKDSTKGFNAIHGDFKMAKEMLKKLRPTGILNARWPPAAESFEGTNCGATPRKVPVSNAQRSKIADISKEI